MRMKYQDKRYNSSVIIGNDNITLAKSSGSEWSYIENTINGDKDTEITIRSKEMAEHLHFMLGQMLDK